MTKIKCVSMESGLIESNTYTGPSGTQYTFFKRQFTEVRDPKDASYFLNCGLGKFFVSEGIGEKVISGVKEIFNIKPEPEVKEEPVNEPEKPEEEVPVTKIIVEEVKKTAADIKALNKRTQDFILKEIKGSDFKTPNHESERIKQILEAQDQGTDLDAILLLMPK